METWKLVLGILQLALGVGWTILVVADRRRPPDERRHFRGLASMRGPTVAAIVWVALGLYWLGWGLAG